MQPTIECKNLWKIFSDQPQEALQAGQQGASKEEIFARFGGVLAVRDVSFSVQPSELFVIMGLSGSGKSTLIRHVNRLIDPTAGQILIDGEDIGSFTAPKLRSFRGSKIGMVFQKTALLPYRSVRDNVAFGLELHHTPRDRRLELAEEMLERVHLDGWGDRYPHELSGGMQQRVGLARALASDSDILLLDEPFSALDPLIRRQLQDLFLDLSRNLKKTTLFITHDLDEAIRLGSRIGIMRAGQLVQVGTPEEIVLHPADDYVADFVQGISRLHLVSAQSVMEPLETLKVDPAEHEHYPQAPTSADLDELVDLAADSDKPIVIVRDNQSVGWINHQQLFRALQGERKQLSDGQKNQDTGEKDSSSLPKGKASYNLLALLLGPLWAASSGWWALFCGLLIVDLLGVVLMVRGVTEAGTFWLVVGLLVFAGGRLGVGLLPTPDDNVQQPTRSRCILGLLFLVLIYPLVIYHFCVGDLPTSLKQFPVARNLQSQTSRFIRDGVDWVADNYEGPFEAITRGVRNLLEFLEVLLLKTPWPVIVLLAVLLSWQAGGGRTALFTGLALLYLGLFRLWDEAMSTLSLVIAATCLCAVIGIPLGILCGRSQRVNTILTPVLDLMQTMPSFVYLIPAVAFFQVGKPPGVLATVIFAMPPMIRLTALGIRHVSPAAKEAALAFGASPGQLLRKVELPLALPSLREGINQTIMLSLSMVVVAALIGAGGLGIKVVRALERLETGEGVLAGLGIVFCAMILDRITRRKEK